MTRNTIRRAAPLALGLALVAGSAMAEDVELRPGAGRELVEQNCNSCHTSAYVQMNSAFLNEAGWTAEVNKMVNVFHAPVPPEDIPRIIAYLTAQYGAR
ncbi:c-type cytochrome [Neoroseomonas oryzicola]|nr:cytochrome c [Neoroseomonas oryzicola]